MTLTRGLFKRKGITMNQKHLYNLHVTTHLLIEKSTAFFRFNITPESALLRFLKANIIRGFSEHNGEFDLYHTHYKKNVLATSWSQEALAEIAGCNVTSIRRQIKKLKEQGFIKVEKVVRYDKTYNIYILGTWEFDSLGKIKENLFSEVHFMKLALAERAEKQQIK